MNNIEYTSESLVGYAPEHLTDKINEMAAQGWEPISHAYYTLNNSVHGTILFKRMS